MQNIYLTGMMGCGKTTLSSLIAARAGMREIDLDTAIATDAGMSIPEIFEKYGEAYFRELESNVLYDVHRLSNLVVSTGGGIVLLDRNVDLMRHSGTIVYIERDVEDILRDIDTSGRPLLDDTAGNLQRIYRERRSIYETAAHCRVRNDGAPEEVAARILETVGAYRAHTPMGHTHHQV